MKYHHYLFRFVTLFCVAGLLLFLGCGGEVAVSIPGCDTCVDRCLIDANKTTRGVKFTFDFTKTWPMRFNKNTNSCLNYHPSFIRNFALAIGYANHKVNRTKTGNSCPRTYIDNNGIFQQTGGLSSQAQIYDIDFFN